MCRCDVDLAVRARAAVLLNFGSAKVRDVVYRALMPEVEKPVSGRSKVELVKEDSCLVLNVEAKDTVALRAALNSYLRWINSLTNILQTLEADKT